MTVLRHIFVYDSSCNFPRVLVGFVPDKLDGDSFVERAVGPIWKW